MSGGGGGINPTPISNQPVKDMSNGEERRPRRRSIRSNEAQQLREGQPHRKQSRINQYKKQKEKKNSQNTKHKTQLYATG